MKKNTAPSLPTDQFSLLTLRSARAHREAAQALEDSAKSLASRIAETQAVLLDLESARAAAAGQAGQLRQQARALALEALSLGIADQPRADSCLAVKFHVADLASTRRHAAKERPNWIPGESFELLLQPDNPVDPNAIMVMQNGKQVGFLAKDDAASLMQMQHEEGWRIAGPAFLHERKGGKWNEGSVHIRLENPILGWSGYNPGKKLGENLAAMEAQALGLAALPPAAKRKATLAL